MKTAEDLDNALDAALEMTFPASDPIAVYIAEPLSVAQNRPSDNTRAAEPRVRPRPGKTITHSMLENAVYATWANVAIAWGLWHAQLEAVQRCGKASAQAAIAWREYLLARWTAPRPATKAVDSASQPPADRHISNLLVRWRNMYEAINVHEALGEIKPQVAQLVENRLEDFRQGLAAARLADRRRLTNVAPADRTVKNA